MSEAHDNPPTLEFVLGRVDAVNNNINDMRRSHIAMQSRFAGMEARFGAMEARFGAMETRFGAMETRIGALETQADQSFAILQQILEQLRPGGAA